MLQVYECFFFLLLVLFAFLCIHMNSNPLQLCLRARSFTVTPVLRTTRMRSQLSGRVSGVATSLTKNQKPMHSMGETLRFSNVHRYRTDWRLVGVPLKFTLQTVQVAFFSCMFDVIFVTYKSMTTVWTRRVSTPPRYVTIPVLPCVPAVPVFLKTLWWCVSPSLESSTGDLPLECCCACVSVNSLYSTSKVPHGPVRCPFPPLAHAFLLVSSVHVWSRSPIFQWVGLWSADKELSRAHPEAHCQKSILFRNRDVHCLQDTSHLRVVWCISYPGARRRSARGGAPFLGCHVSW